MEPFNCDDRLFVYDKKNWKIWSEADYSLPDPPTVTEVEAGFILPLKKRKDINALEAAYEGGVCDREGEFIAGIYRNLGNLSTNRSCAKAYPIPSAHSVRHETVIFGGIWYGSFPESITECLCRLWYYADHPETPYKFVFLHAGTFSPDYVPYELLDIIGLTADRIEILREPTQFDKIIVPQESLYMVTNYRPGMEKIYDYIRNSVTPGPYKKIYLSREKFAKKDVVNESYFSEFYRKRGYEIIYPEQLPLKEQLSILAGADEIVAPQGTLGEFSGLYSKPNTRVVILNRGQYKTHDMPLFQGKKVNFYYIDAYFGFFPSITNSIYLLGPTVYWKEYLDKTGISYEPEEVSFDLQVKPYICDYLLKWGDWYYTSPARYKVLRNEMLVDVLKNINVLFFQREIDRKSYPDRDDVIRLKKERVELNNQLTVQEKTFNSAVKQMNNELTNTLNAQNKKLTETLNARDEELIKVLKAQNEVLQIQLAEEREMQAKEREEERKRETERLRQQNEKLRLRLTRMEGSFSWRITKPLRAVRAWLKRLLGK